MPRSAYLVLALAAAALALPLAAAPAASKTLTASVGPGATIVLKTSAGKKVTSVPAGVYTIVVQDRSDEHNFRLAGPGVNRATGVESTGKKVWRGVRIAKGKRYTYLCDPHADHMRGAVRGR